MKRLKPDRAEVIALILVSALATSLLFLPPFIGLADNGDYFRLISWGKFLYPPLEYRDQFFGWVTREYVVAKSPFLAWRGFPSSEALFIKISAILGLFFSRERFDLRVLGFVHLLAFIGACGLLLRGWRDALPMRRMILIPGLLMAFCDIGYLTYFHSFYSEPASLIFLFATVGLGLMLVASDLRSRRLLVLFHSAAFCLTAAKPQNLPFVVALLPITVWLHFASIDAVWQRINLAAFSLVVVTALITLSVLPSRMREANLYNSVFNGILRNSSSPGDDLVALGVPREYEVLKQTTYFDPVTIVDIQSDEFRSRFHRKIGPSTVIAFYLTHPGRYLDKLAVTSKHAYTLQPPNLGNFEKASGMPFGSTTRRWSWWSQAKRNFVPGQVWFSLAYLGALLLLLVGQWRRGQSRGLQVLLFSLWLMMVMSFVVPILGDGENDIEKHLFLFSAFFDLSVILVASHLLQAVWRRLDARSAS